MSLSESMPTPESTWLACNDPDPMLRLLYGRISDRKLRLFAVACCRAIWSVFNDRRCRLAVEVAEQFADGRATIEDLSAADDVRLTSRRVTLGMLASFVARAPWKKAKDPIEFVGSCRGVTCLAQESFAKYKFKNVDRDPHQAATRKHQAVLLRDVVGNPFRAPSLDPSWLKWSDSTLPKIAQAIYEERRFGDMPILADALEDAGCDDEDILRHCREPGEHVRGCWVIDLLLGKS